MKMSAGVEWAVYCCVVLSRVPREVISDPHARYFGTELDLQRGRHEEVGLALIQP